MPFKMVSQGENFSFTSVVFVLNQSKLLYSMYAYMCVYIHIHTHTHTVCHKAILNKYFCWSLYNRLPIIFTLQVSLCLHVYMHTHRLCTRGHLCDRSAKFFRVWSELSTCLPNSTLHCWVLCFCCGFLPLLPPSPSLIFKASFPLRLIHCFVK